MRQNGKHPTIPLSSKKNAYLHMAHALRHTILLLSCLFILGHNLWPHAHDSLVGQTLSGNHTHLPGDLQGALTHAFSVFQGEGHLSSFSPNEFKVQPAATSMHRVTISFGFLANFVEAAYPVGKESTQLPRPPLLSSSPTRAP